MDAAWDDIVADLCAADDVSQAIAARHALDRAADPSRLPQLLHLLLHGRNFFIRESAADPVARLEGLRALPQLLDAWHLGLQEGHDNDGFTELICDLVASEPHVATPLLLEMLRSSSERSRYDAAWLLGYAAEATSPEPLMQAASDQSAEVRANAIGALGSFKGREDVFATLVRALEDSDERVRAEAASTLGYYRDRRAVSVLRAVVRDTSRQVQSSAREALERLKGRFA